MLKMKFILKILSILMQYLLLNIIISKYSVWCFSINKYLLNSIKERNPLNDELLSLWIYYEIYIKKNII